MKKSLSLLLILLPVIAYCGDKKMSGNWKEISRKNGKYDVPYSDTIMIKFLTGNEYVWQKKGGFIYRGTYKMESNALDMGSRYFTIVENKGNRLVLKDDAGTYEFMPYTEVLADNTPAPPETYRPVASIGQMTGHWSVYKATNDKTHQSIDYSRQIKMVDIYPSAKDGKWGAFYSRRDADNAPSWAITNYTNQTLYCTGKDNREFHVIKCENNDLILEGEGTTYFFRQFK